MTRIITHRGLDPSISDFPAESSREAFEAHLARGFGIEFDPQRAADGLVVLHDVTLARSTRGTDTRRVSDVSIADILGLDLQGSHLATFGEILRLIDTCSAPDAISFIHLKHSFQSDRANLDALLQELRSVNTEKVVLFDAKKTTARYLKDRNHQLHIAGSVSHTYDIERFNSAVGGTLLSIEEILASRELFDWAWLDEWDTCDAVGAKKFYTEDNLSRLRDAGIRSVLVSPELHATSPALLGGESHQDARDIKTLETRLEEMLAHTPDAVCTDYPDLVAKLMARQRGQ